MKWMSLTWHVMTISSTSTSFTWSSPLSHSQSLNISISLLRVPRLFQQHSRPHVHSYRHVYFGQFICRKWIQKTTPFRCCLFVCCCCCCCCCKWTRSHMRKWQFRSQSNDHHNRVLTFSDEVQFHCYKLSWHCQQLRSTMHDHTSEITCTYTTYHHHHVSSSLITIIIKPHYHHHQPHHHLIIIHYHHHHQPSSNLINHSHSHTLTLSLTHTFT